MVSTPDSDLYPTITYRDPLLFPLYLRTHTPSSLWQQIQGDFLLNAYITKLDEEICNDIPELKDWKAPITEMMDSVRGLGWCIVVEYEDEIKIFNYLHFEDWIKESEVQEDGSSKIIKKGAKVHWVDELGNDWKEDLLFDDPSVHLVIWQKGNSIQIKDMPSDTRWAVPDLSLALLTIAINARQIKGNLDFAAAHPGFKHFVYGDSIAPDQRQNLINQMGYTSLTNGIGAKEGVLKEIRVVEDNVIEKNILALDENIACFAAASRLPLSFYMGEKQTGGLGDTGESTDEVKLMAKKEFILGHFAEVIAEITGVDVSEFYAQKREEAKAEKEAEMNKSQDQQGGKADAKVE